MITVTCDMNHWNVNGYSHMSRVTIIWHDKNIVKCYYVNESRDIWRWSSVGLHGYNWSLYGVHCLTSIVRRTINVIQYIVRRTINDIQYIVRRTCIGWSRCKMMPIFYRYDYVTSSPSSPKVKCCITIYTVCTLCIVYTI